MTYTIAVFDASDNAVMVPGNLAVTPVTWSAIARGGMADAEVQIAGDLAQLAGLTAWLGYRLEIINERGTAVWWGDIATVEILSGGLRRGISLDRLANKVSVRYSQIQPGGTAAAADTAWASDTASIAKYGTAERRISPSRPLSAAEATAYGATALVTLATPHYTLMPEDGTPTAIVRCTGLWQRLGRTYYAQAAGLEENNTTGVAVPLGQGFTSVYVGFSANTDTIHEMAGKFAKFATGSTVKVTGSTSNNASYEIVSVDDRVSVGIVSTNVVFDPADDITDSNQTLGFLNRDDLFTIAGSASNSGTHLLKTEGGQHVEVSPGYYGADIDGETAGPPITIVRGNNIGVNGSLTNEGVNDTVTVTTWGQQIYTTFALSAALTWTVGKVEIKLRKVGNPADTVIVRLTTDSGGSPNTLIENSVAVAAADIPVESGWVSFDFANTSSVVSGTTYGLQIYRTGANSESDFYEVEVDDALGYSRGAMKVYDGAAWQTPSPDTDLIFRVLGEYGTGKQVELILATQDWVRRMDVVTSGLVSNQWRDGELTALDELTSLLDMGTSGASRMIAKVTRDRAAIVTARPSKSTARWIWQRNGLTDAFGQSADAGYLPAGEWVRLGEAQDLGPWAALSPVFVERAEYSITGGWRLEPEGQADAYDLGVQQG
jgi:hypothetical protein